MLAGQGKQLTELQKRHFLHAKLHPLLAVPGLHADGIPPACAWGWAPAARRGCQWLGPGS